MPEFFFHISIELLVQPFEQQGDRAILSWPGGSQALSPFLASKEPSSPDILTTSRGAGTYPSTRKENGGLAKGLNPLPNEFPKDWLPPPSTTAPDDKRLDQIFIESTNISTQATTRDKMDGDNQIGKGIGTSANGLQTKGRYEPLDQQISDSVWGIVHLYRDADETPGLYGDSLLSKPSNPWYSRAPQESNGKFHPPAANQDCTALCILAVPSYLAPSDFLGFVGEETREQVRHFRMIKTGRANRYMVLIKFRCGKMARKWQKAWNGKVFNSMEVTSTLGTVYLRLT